MPFLFGMNNDVTIFLCVADMIIESYIAIHYVNSKNYKYNDVRRIIIGVLSLLTVLFCLTQFSFYSQETSSEKLLLVFAFVGSVIISTYMFLTKEANFENDWRRKFVEIYYYIAIGLAVATILGVKDAQEFTRLNVEGTKKTANSLVNATKNVVDGVASASSNVVSGVGNIANTTGSTVKKVGSDLVKGITDIGNTSLKTGKAVSSNLMTGVSNASKDLKKAITN